MGKLRKMVGGFFGMLLMSLGVSSPAKKPRPAAKPAPPAPTGDGR